MITIIQRSTNFYNEFYVHIVVWIILVREYDEMKCNFVSGVFFTMYYEMQILIIWNNHEYGVLINGKVKCVRN
jgi:hypothetical protein